MAEVKEFQTVKVERMTGSPRVILNRGEAKRDEPAGWTSIDVLDWS